MSLFSNKSGRKILTTTVLVAALGYFVDIYDLIIFGIVRVESLKELGIVGDELTKNGVFILNMQMAGMLIGGLIWGIYGDKKGRISVLFGSIAMYSIANISNAFVTSVNMYAFLRFMAGVGLAGELGAAVTLVSETMHKEVRGYGTAIVASVGVTGAIAAALIGDLFSWKAAYIIGGVLGLLLLATRVKMYESGMFAQIADNKVRKGNFLALFTSKDRFFRYLNATLIGLPIWFSVGVLVTFSPEFGKAMGIQGPVSAGKALLFTYTGLIFGDFLSGFVSQWMRSRKKVVLIFIGLTTLVVAYYLTRVNISVTHFYGICIALGWAVGYWAVFVTTSSEQFGTNLRATVTTTVPNFIRGSVVPITLAFDSLRHTVGMVNSAIIVGGVCLVLSLLSLYFLEETFGKDLDYLENI